MAVVVFGVFDLFHPGHRYFLDQSRSKGDPLIVVVTRDSIVSRLKNRLPIDDEMTRLNNIKQYPSVDTALLGDEELGVYSVLHEYRPTTICLGHDQTSLRRDLEERMKQKLCVPKGRSDYQLAISPNSGPVGAEGSPQDAPASAGRGNGTEPALAQKTIPSSCLISIDAYYPAKYSSTILRQLLI